MHEYAKMSFIRSTRACHGTTPQFHKVQPRVCGAKRSEIHGLVSCCNQLPCSFVPRAIYRTLRKTGAGQRSRRTSRPCPLTAAPSLLLHVSNSLDLPTARLDFHKEGGSNPKKRSNQTKTENQKKQGFQPKDTSRPLKMGDMRGSLSALRSSDQAIPASPWLAYERGVI